MDGVDSQCFAHSWVDDKSRRSDQVPTGFARIGLDWLGFDFLGLDWLGLDCWVDELGRRAQATDFGFKYALTGLSSQAVRSLSLLGIQLRSSATLTSQPLQWSAAIATAAGNRRDGMLHPMMTHSHTSEIPAAEPAAQHLKVKRATNTQHPNVKKVTRSTKRKPPSCHQRSTSCRARCHHLKVQKATNTQHPEVKRMAKSTNRKLEYQLQRQMPNT